MRDNREIEQADPDADAIARGYESRDLKITALLYLFAGFVAVFVLLCGVVWWLYKFEVGRPVAGSQPRSVVVGVPNAGETGAGVAAAPPLQPQAGHESLDAWDVQNMRAGEDAAFAEMDWKKDGRTRQFVVPPSVIEAVQKRQPATRPAEGGR